MLSMIKKKEKAARPDGKSESSPSTGECRDENQPPSKRGRFSQRLCPNCQRTAVGAAVEFYGNLAEAWRWLHEKEILCPKCNSLWHFDPRTEKCCVPLAVKNQIMPEVFSTLPRRYPTIVKFGQRS
jgi:hypothetical protein